MKQQIKDEQVTAPRWAKVSTVATYLDMGKQTVRDLIRQGVFPAVRGVTSDLRIDLREVDRAMENRTR
jgi:excisionase family DNA binding protein